jgi:hypothetical protein
MPRDRAHELVWPNGYGAALPPLEQSKRIGIAVTYQSNNERAALSIPFNVAEP